MPGPVRYAKSEHNCGTTPKCQFCGGVGRPCVAPHERDQHPLARLHRLVGEEDDDRVFGESAHEGAGGAAAVDDFGAGARAAGGELALEQLVVERTGDGADVAHMSHQRQAADLPSAEVAAEEECPLSAGTRLLEKLRVDEGAALRELFERVPLRPDELEHFPPEVAPRLVERLAQLTLAAGGKRRAEVAHREAVAGTEDAAAECAEARSPARDPLFGHAAHRAGDEPVDGVFDALEDPVFSTPGHVQRRRSARAPYRR